MLAGASALALPAAAQAVVTPEAFNGWVAAAEARALLEGVSDTSIRAARQGLMLNPSLIRPAGGHGEQAGRDLCEEPDRG